MHGRRWRLCLCNKNGFQAKNYSAHKPSKVPRVRGETVPWHKWTPAECRRRLVVDTEWQTTFFWRRAVSQTIKAYLCALSCFRKQFSASITTDRGRVCKSNPSMLRYVGQLLKYMLYTFCEIIVCCKQVEMMRYLDFSILFGQCLVWANALKCLRLMRMLNENVNTRDYFLYLPSNDDPSRVYIILCNFTLKVCFYYNFSLFMDSMMAFVICMLIAS